MKLTLAFRVQVKYVKVVFDLFKIKDYNQVMTMNVNDTELGLCNPYSKITCILFNLYQMELGIPPLYAEINRVTREMDPI